ncbi:phosphatidic acid phosphatase type 2/haloperoxidase [Mrakia frigida]|uniref:phosphatase PAP2 family protein n=1 Tax=Mrakia frigida TaxID=29902 RepID=UPI003FCC063B
MASLQNLLPQFYSTRAAPDEHVESHKKATFREIFRHYGVDWALAVLLWFLLGYLNQRPGHKREFSLHSDISIQHTFAVEERVPAALLLGISLLFPLASVLLISLFVMRSTWDAHNSALSVLMSWTVSGIVTQVIKIMVGRPRPDLLDRCVPYAGAQDAPIYGLSNYTVCTQTDAFILNDGFKSFPSGHSSLSFAGLGLLAFYLSGKLHLFSTRGHKARAWLALLPLLAGIMVAVSRTMDNRHHWQDVLVGSLLGLSISFITYRGYYPPLAHRHSHLPYAPRELDGDEFSEEGVQLGNGSANGRYERVAGNGGEERVVTRPTEAEDED